MEDLSDTPWFVAQLRPQGLTRARAHLDNQGFLSFAPELQTTAVKAGASKQTRKPLFPGYLFVSFDPKTAGWSAINNTRGVARLILGDPRNPMPLPRALIAGLQARCDASGLLMPPADLSVGDQIRVLSGPFADLVTTIETLAGPERVGVLIEIMGRQVRTSLPRAQIERLD